MSAERPTVLFDGDCGFCLDAVARWRVSAGDAVELLPHQERGERFANVPLEDCQRSIQWIAGDERREGRGAH